ncbi:O-antigen ligase family protein [Rhodococcus sp. CSLK01-03]|uniref:O-antigen ligase family protein n=1 Tax=Rhodococcus indonesiensis TaxID=3055869 RepID=A0ABT7RUX8_9NOCA|nr:O-antigen ligase family protein [Rhodococcus indonesiensis]MDM7491458.1 O-antigen ligase family protein [Rhodococcus indonesiensis]
MTTATSLKPRVPIIVTIALAWALVVDIPTGIGLGPLSLSGAATLGVAVALLLLTPALFIARTATVPPTGESPSREPYLDGRLNHPTLPVAMKLFVAWAVVTLALQPSPDGLQNTAVYVMFLAAIPIVATSSSVGTAEWILRAFRFVAPVVGVVAAAQSLAGVEIYGPRSVALLLVVFVAATLVMPKRTRLDRVLPFLLIAACALTLSRTAFFVSAILIPVSMLLSSGRGKFFKVLAAAVPAYLVMYWLITTWAPLRDRFLEGDAAYNLGGVALNTSGRSVLWEMTIDSWRGAFWTGHGPGSASAMITAQFRNISHPHNEYLRILHDLGMVGLLLFAVGMLALIMWTWRRAVRLGHPIHKAATLALIGIAAVSVTDNVLVYPFVMLPTAILVGASMSYPLTSTSTPAVAQKAPVAA